MNHYLEKYLFFNKIQTIVATLVLIVLAPYICQAQLGGSAGAFTRMGFGARGIGMGNALTAVSSGSITPYYNPALAAYSEYRTVSATFGILSLDRNLNFISYTQAIKPNAGVSAGLINAGVKKIDGRDADGYHTEDYSTTENQFFFTFANRVEDRVSLGVTFKLYYSKLFDEVSSTTVGFDIGIYVQIADNFSVGGILQDINSKYRWDTKALYGQMGKTTEDKFPNLRRIALAYTLSPNRGTVSFEFQNTSDGTNIMRFGVEYNLIESFTLRGGIDRWELHNSATGAKPSFGFSLKNSFNGIVPELNYAYVFEPYSQHGIHIITLTTMF